MQVATRKSAPTKCWSSRDAGGTWINLITGQKERVGLPRRQGRWHVHHAGLGTGGRPLHGDPDHRRWGAQRLHRRGRAGHGGRRGPDQDPGRRRRLSTPPPSSSSPRAADGISNVAHETLAGHLRAILGTLDGRGDL